MKRLSVFVLVLVLLATTALPVLAAGGPPPGRGGAGRGAKAPFALVGTIASLDATAKTVTVAVVSGNQVVKPFIGQSLTLQTSDITRFLLRNPGGQATPIAFEDLAVGQQVSASGPFADDVWNAVRITVGAALDCQR